MLFPPLGPAYYDEKNKNILSRMEAFYTQNITPNQSFWMQADIDSRFECGDQSIFNEYYGPGSIGANKQFSFNQMRPIKNMVDGHQRRNRKSTIAVPVENGDSETADQFTKLLMWVNNQENVLETISDSFGGSLVTGLNFLHVYMDYREDPVSGNIKVDNCSYNSFLIDPFFKKQDLSDCNGIWKRSYITKREAVSLLPDKESEIMDLQMQDFRDGKFQYMAENFNFDITRLLAYDEFYYRDYRTQRMLVDTRTGETLEWRGNDEDTLNKYLMLYPEVTVIKQDIPTVNLAIVVQGKVMYDGPQPSGLDTYGFIPVFAYYNPHLPYLEQRIQGIVRGMRDPQYLYNRFIINMCDMLETQVNSGWKYKPGSLINPADVYNSGNGKGLAFKDEASLQDAEKIIPGEASQSMFKLADIFSNMLFKTSGANEELMGAAVDDKAGILSMLRQGAGLTTLQILFDNLDHAQKLLGKTMIDLIQLNWTPGKVKKILEGAEPTPQFYNKAFGKYHAVVEDGLNTSTQRQMQFAQMLELRAAGVQITDEDLLEAATLQGKKKIIENAQASAQAQQQMQQLQLQAQIQEQQARTELAHARAIADKGLGLERVSRVEENHALAEERRAEAEKDKDIGFLNLVKALKEIDTMDLAHLEKLLLLSHSIKDREAGVAAAEKGMRPTPESRTSELLSGLAQPTQPMQQQQPTQNQTMGM